MDDLIACIANAHCVYLHFTANTHRKYLQPTVNALRAYLHHRQVAQQLDKPKYTANTYNAAKKVQNRRFGAFLISQSAKRLLTTWTSCASNLISQRVTRVGCMSIVIAPISSKRVYDTHFAFRGIKRTYLKGYNYTTIRNISQKRSSRAFAWLLCCRFSKSHFSIFFTRSYQFP